MSTCRSKKKTEDGWDEDKTEDTSRNTKTKKKITTDKTDTDIKGRQEGLEDFLRDINQCQANVVMCQETHN